MSDPMPKVRVYPLCGECGAPCVLRHGYNLSSGKEVWLWYRDCKHKKAALVSSTKSVRNHPAQRSGT